MAGHFSRKAVETPIAIIMALMMVTSASTAMFYWFTQLQGQEQGSVESSQTRLFDTLTACISIPQFDFNTLDNISNAVVQNCGNAKLTVGDALIPDTVVVSTNPCTFILNGSTCDGCPASLEVGDIKLLKLTWNQTNCLASLESGVKNQITLHVDRRATASRSFVPTPDVKCGVSLTNETVKERTVADTLIADYNMTITNTGNAQDTFTVSNATNTNCDVTTLYNGSWSYSTKSVVLNSKASARIILNNSASGAGITCTSTVTATSNNCQSKSASITLTTTAP